MTMFFVLFFPFFLFFTSEVEPRYGIINGVKPVDDYAKQTYLAQFRLMINEDFNAIADSKDGYPLSDVFNGKVGANTGFWVGKKATTDNDKNNIQMIFSQIQIIECIVCYPIYKSLQSRREYHGFPTKLNVYASTIDDDSDYQLKYQVISNPETDISKAWNSVLIKFPHPLTCKKLRLEFVEVTPDPTFSNGALVPVLNELYILKNHTFAHLSIQKAANPYTETNYLNANKVTVDECEYVSSGDADGFPLSSIFIADLTNYWRGSEPNNDTFSTTLNYTFHKAQLIESIVYHAAWATESNVRVYKGFPKVLNIYTSTSSKNYELKIVNTGYPPDSSWSLIHIQFPEPFWSNELVLEFEHVTPNQVGEPTPQAFYLLLMKSPNVNELEPPPFESDNSENKNEAYNVNIQNSTFSEKHGKDYGSAIFLKNCDTKLEADNFINCSSNIAGGAIYINTEVEGIAHQTKLPNLTFTNCQSNNGGAVCVIAIFDNDFTSIVNCIFNSNSARGQGSAIYLAAKHGEVKASKFSSNTGLSIIKYASSEPAASSRLLTSGNLEISDCSFEDDIKEGSFYIDVDESFDSKGISLKDNKFKSNDIKQAIKINQSPIQHERKAKSSLFLTILVPTLCVISLLLIIFIIFEHKNSDQQSEQEENHNEELTQDEV